MTAEDLLKGLLKMKGLKKLAVLCAGCITFAGIASVMPANRLLKTDTTVYASSEKPSEIVTEGLFTFLKYPDCAYLLSCDENAEGKVVIPDKINGAPVTTISGLSRYWSGDFKDAHAFYGCTKITSVVIPDSVTSINRKAFGDCTSLREITIPDSVSYIGEDAFSGTPWLKAKQKENPLVTAGSILIDGTTCKGKVAIPDGVTSIGVNAFVNCSALTGITIPDSVTSIEESAFENCSGLTGITIPDGVTSIGNRAFENCSGLTGITIPTSVSDIGGRIFSGTGIQKITVPGGVKEIYGTTFLECSELTDLTILDPFCNLYDTVVSNTGSTFSGVIHGYDGSTAEKYATEHNIRFESLGAFSYTDAYGRCGDNATWKIDKDYTMVISGTGEMESYGGYEARFAFYWNYKDYIKKIRIEEGITGIPGQAFRNLDQVTDISFPKSLKTINSFAVDETLWWKKQLETEDFIIINDILVKCNVQGKVTVPDTVHSIMPNSFENDGITELVLPDGLTELESWILTYSTIKAVTLPESLTRLGYYAFEGCRSLEEIVIPEKTESIGSGAFSNCESLKSITILNPGCEIFDEARTISDKVNYDYNMDTGESTITASYSGVIRGYAGSTAEAYAKKYGYTFEALSKEAVTTTAKAVTTTAQAATTTAKAATTTAKAVTTTADRKSVV